MVIIVSGNGLALGVQQAITWISQLDLSLMKNVVYPRIKRQTFYYQKNHFENLHFRFAKNDSWDQWVVG